MVAGEQGWWERLKARWGAGKRLMDDDGAEQRLRDLEERLAALEEERRRSLGFMVVESINDIVASVNELHTEVHELKEREG